MAKAQKGQPQIGKGMGQMPCPGCGNMVTTDRWTRIDIGFETIVCTCHRAWGRILVNKYSLNTEWHFMGTMPCDVCGSTAWWQRADGGWVCERCHPKPG